LANGCRYISHKEETQMKFNGRWKKNERKNTEIWKAKEKAMDTDMGKIPGYQSLIVWKLT